MPSLEMFEKQPSAYKNKVINKEAKLVFVIEASNDTKWYKVLGDRCEVFGINQYVGNGNGDELLDKGGFTVKNLVKVVESCLKQK